MTRTSLKSLFYFLLREKSTNTSISETNLNTLLDIGYQKAVEDVLPDTLYTSQIVTVPETTFASRTNATTVVLASGTSFASNTDVVIYQGSRYDELRCTNVVTNTLTVSSPGLVYTSYTASTAKVVPISFIVTEYRDVVGVSFRNLTTSDNYWYPLEAVSQAVMFEKGSQPTSTGTPSMYCLKSPTELRIYPIPDSSGYLDIRYRNKTQYTLSADESSPSQLETDDHIMLVVWALYLTACRNKYADDMKYYYELYQFLAMQARGKIRVKKDINSKWQLKEWKG